MKPQDPPHNTREAWWVLRYRKSGDAFAVADFHEEERWESMDNRGSMLIWQHPWQFKFMIEDVRNGIIIMKYDAERITQSEFETLLEFRSLPMVHLRNYVKENGSTVQGLEIRK